MKLNSSIIRQSINELNVPWKSQWESWVGHSYVDEEGLRLLDRPLLGIVSSHLKQNAFASQRWQNALMSALSFAREQNATVFYSASTPYAAAIRNACIKTNSHSIQVDELQLGSLRSTVGCGNPTVAIDCEQDAPSPDIRALPFLDRLIIALSHQVFVIDIDPAGKIAKLIERRLLSAEFPKGSVFLAHHSRTEPPRKHRWVQSQLDRGAVAWLVSDAKQKTAPVHCQEGTHFCSVPVFPAKMLTQSASSFLIHCTRARQGAWPDQSTSQFYDELLINPWASPPSSLQSLQRILESQRLVATSRLKSGVAPTISFTQRTLSELLTARTFEAHLARWDWEPYGLMISRQWLEGVGCKPVIYLRRDELKNVSAEDMIFTQPYEEKNTANKKGRDWRVEQEWRLLGDLRLHQVPLSRAIVFVKHSWEARLLATISNWPICFTES